MNVVLNTDGGARGNPGPAATGVVIKNERGKKICSFGKYIGKKTNNEAEYSALVHGLEKAAELGATQALCLLDSELIVKQLNGEYKVKQPHLKLMWNDAKNIEKKFKKVVYCHIPRTKNKEADRLVNETLDKVMYVG